MELILASASPRRRELLARFGLPFEVLPAEIDETLPPGVSVAQAVAELARRKARIAAARLGPATSGAASPRSAIVIAADTLVVLDGRPFGKPLSRADARRMLSALRGRTHQVVTAVAVVETATGREDVEAVTSEVTMRQFDDAELERYLATGESADKAGAYALQGAGGRLVAGVEGSATNVIGLPLETLLRLLRRVGVAVSEPVPFEPPPGLRGLAASGPDSPVPR
jgi:septum formation protein